MSTNHTPTRALRRAQRASAACLALAGLAGFAGCSATNPVTATAKLPTVTASPTVTAKDACVGTVVTVRWDEQTVCDVSPPQRLDIVFDESYDPAWGGDAAVERAADECNDMGGEPIWTNDGNYRLVCEGVDY